MCIEGREMVKVARKIKSRIQEGKLGIRGQKKAIQKVRA